MSRVIHKSVIEGHTPEIPADAELLDVQLQGGLLTAWYMTDPESNRRATRRLRVVGTGWAAPTAAQAIHVATVQDEGFVWHVFDPIRPDTETSRILPDVPKQETAPVSADAVTQTITRA